MTSLLISPASPAELELVTALLKKMNISALPLSDDDKEDFGLSLMIKEAMNDPEFVSREEIMRQLGQG